MNPHNSCCPLATEALEAPADLLELELLGYTVYPVARIQVLHSDPGARYASLPIHRLRVGRGHHDLVLSGTYRTVRVGGGVRTVGPVVRGGRLDTSGIPEARFRGGVAVLGDGSIVVGRQDGSHLRDLKATFGQPGAPLVDFIGGGAVLLEGGAPVPDRDLLVNQHFLGTPGGIHAKVMGADVHGLMGIRKGQCFAIVAHQRTAVEIRAHLHRVGFGTVVKFDRGSGLYVNDGVNRILGQNPSGFGIHVHRSSAAWGRRQDGR